MNNYKAIFDAIETTLFRIGSNNISEETLRKRLAQYKNFESKSFSDSEYYWKLVCVIFYSGFKAATVTARLDQIQKYFPDHKTVAGYHDPDIHRILNQSEMIKNRRKIDACIDNANTFKDIVNKHSSFQEYIDSFAPTESFENLMLLKEEIECRFNGLGRITTYHFLTEIGMPVIKPDRVICLIFRRLGLIEDENQILKAVVQGRKFASKTAYPARYIDIVFVTYGQVQSPEFGIEKGICLEKNPKCSICGVQDFCNFNLGG